MGCGQAHHFVNDELADIEGEDRLEGAHEPQAHAGKRQPSARSPDLGDKPRKKPQIAQLVAEAAAG